MPTARRRPDHLQLAAIFVGGVLGGLLRALLSELLPADPDQWPWPTFTANIAGAFALGYLATRLEAHLPPTAHRRLLLETGLCGALTTFSAMQVELVRLFEHGASATAVAYATVSIAAGLTVVVAASRLARRARPAA